MQRRSPDDPILAPDLKSAVGGGRLGRDRILREFKRFIAINWHDYRVVMSFRQRQPRKKLA